MFFKVLRYCIIDPPGLLEITDPHSHKKHQYINGNSGLIKIEEITNTIYSLGQEVEPGGCHNLNMNDKKKDLS